MLVTALLHLFFMASFSWMLVEGLLLWSKVVSVNISEERRMHFYYALGWGTGFALYGSDHLQFLDTFGRTHIQQPDYITN